MSYIVPDNNVHLLFSNHVNTSEAMVFNYRWSRKFGKGTSIYRKKKYPTRWPSLSKLISLLLWSVRPSNMNLWLEMSKLRSQIAF